MIKENNKPLFHPTFGSRPAQIVGREQMIEDYMQGLQEPVGSRGRCRFYTGQRGTGKTALLLELAERATALDYVTACVTVYEGMCDDIIETIQRSGAAFVTDSKKKISGVSAGALGFSFGLTFTDETKKQFGFRAKLTMLCDELAKYGKRILILVDEARTSETMRQLAITYQHLIGEDRDIAIVMAGLPQAVSAILNDDVLTFLNRASKTKLDPIHTNEIRDYYHIAFQKLEIHLSDRAVERAAASAMGFPYLMQLIGYHISKQAPAHAGGDERWVQSAIRDAKKEMEENVFTPVLAPLSDMDLAFLRAMSVDQEASKISDICKRMNRPNSYVQPYRARLIDAGIIESQRKGEVVFAIPYLRDYLSTGIR